MSALNQIIIEGNAVKDSVVKEKPWGTKFCIVTLAVNRYFKDRNGNFGDEVGYFDIHVFGESNITKVAKFGKKGFPLRAIGRLKQERWEGKDGKKVTKNYIVAQHVDVLKKAKPEDEKSEKTIEEKKKVLENLAQSYAGILSELDDTETSIDISEEEATF